MTNSLHKKDGRYRSRQTDNGGLDSVTEKRIEKMVAKFSQTHEIQLPAPKLNLSSGTKLIREFKGRKHEVLVLEQGFEYKNEAYKSLSAIANKITGTRWNGKKFFGVIK